jgi:hypothetical protein
MQARGSTSQISQRSLDDIVARTDGFDHKVQNVGQHAAWYEEQTDEG